MKGAKKAMKVVPPNGNLKAPEKLMISKDNSTVVVSRDMFQKDICALEIKNCVNSTFIIPKGEGQRLIKLFIEECEDCIFQVEHLLITQHLEVSHCSNISISIKAPLATLQVDLCDGIKVAYDANFFNDGTKVVHAGVKGMQLTNGALTHEFNYLENIVTPSSVIPEEQQFVTQLVNDAFRTTRYDDDRTFGDDGKQA